MVCWPEGGGLTLTKRLEFSIAFSESIQQKKAQRMLGRLRKNPETGNKPAENPGDPRQPHSIRFSNSEWKLIEKTAARRGVPAGEFVRSSAVAVAEDRDQEAPPVTLSKGHAALIEEIYRFGFILATLKREDLLDADRGDEVDELIAAAREAMAETLLEGPT